MQQMKNVAILLCLCGLVPQVQGFRAPTVKRTQSLAIKNTEVSHTNKSTLVVGAEEHLSEEEIRTYITHLLKTTDFTHLLSNSTLAVDAEDKEKVIDLLNYVTYLWRTNILMGGAGDPTCKTGMASLDYTVCCKKSCKSCEDVATCADPVKYLEETGTNADDCCPRRIKKKFVPPRFKSCKGKSPPCNLPPGLLKKMQNFKFPESGRHAMDD
jgi:hypothetical protein